MSSIFANRLKSARLQAGLSQEALAQLVEPTKQSISKYELGKMEPDSRVLLQLSKALNKQPDYFFRPFRVSLEQVEFRKRARLTGRKLESIKGQIVDTLERYLEIEEHLNRRFQFENPLARHPITDGASIEEAALALLHKWDLGINPIPNVVEMLEGLGVKVIEIEADGTFDGLSAFVNENIPVIVLNSSFDVLRKRFTALHELGHLLLQLDKNCPKKECEKICNRFAGAMLLPKPAAIQELGEKRHHLALRELIAIKESYGISMQAIIYRAGDLGIISKSAQQQFWKWRSKKKEHKLEIGFGEYHSPESSSRFRQLLHQAVAEGIITLSKGAALANQSLKQFKEELNIVV